MVESIEYYLILTKITFPNSYPIQYVVERFLDSNPYLKL